MINKDLEITIVSSFTITPVMTSLRFWLDKICHKSSIFMEAYNQIFQSLISLKNGKTSNVYIIFLRIEDMYQKDDRTSDINYIENNIDQFILILKQTATMINAQFLVILCPESPYCSKDKKKFKELELKIKGCLSDNTNVTVVLSSEVKSYCRVRKWYNEYTDKIAHIPYTPLQFVVLGTVAARKIFNLFCDPIKVIAVDCDNTLWSGACAEDGALGVKITKKNQFIQSFLKKQQKQGKLICLVSKNELRDVFRVFEQNKGMLLRSSDIVASKINWEKKSENLVQLSKELNLGLDSFLFIDDNPVECAEVASLGSGISVVNLPEDKSWSILLKNIWRLDSRRVTKEDKKRSAFYKSNYQRENLKHKATSFYDFIVNLGLKLKFSKLSSKDIGRASQLSQRTNQFNLVANRYYEDDLQKMMNTVPGNLMCTVSAKDRFGDYGIIGFLVCSLNTSNDALSIDGLFLSCRILGRGAEFSILSYIVKVAEEEQLDKVCFNLKKTDRNIPAQQFLQNIIKKERLSDGSYSVSIEDLKKLRLLDFLPSNTPKVPIQTVSEKPLSIKDDPSLFIDLTVKYANLNLLQKELQIASHRTLELQKEPVVKHTALQRVMIQSLEEVLSMSPLGINDNFYALGVSSLQAMLFLGNVFLKTNISIPLTDFFQYPSILQLAERIENRVTVKEDRTSHINSEETALSAEEKRMWLLHNTTSPSAYNILFAQHLYGNINTDKLLNVIKRVQKELNVFRVQFIMSNDTVLKYLNKSCGIDVTEIEKCDSLEIQNEIISFSSTVFNLEKAPLAKIKILIVDEHHVVFCFLASHIVIDRWGMKLLFDLISDLYNNPRLSVDDRILFYNGSNSHPIFINKHKLLDFWKKELDSYPEAISLPYDLPSPLIRTYRGHIYTAVLSETNRQRIIALSKGMQCSVFTIILALFRAFLYRYSNQNDCTIGIPFANREGPSAAFSINLALNTLVFRVEVNENETLKEHIEKTKKSLTKILDNSKLPFDELIRALDVKRSGSSNPVFQIMFVYSQEEDQPVLSLADTRSEIINVDVGISKFDLTLFAHNRVGGIDLTLEYSTDLFEDATIKVMLERFINFIGNAIQNLEQPIGRVKIFTPMEYKKFFLEYNETKNNKSYDVRIDDLFQKTLKAFPNKVVVIYNENEFTYKDIDDRANSLCRLLKRRKSLVGIFMPSILDQAIASLAVLKSGSTYVPLDISSPTRVDSIIASTGLDVIITHEQYSDILATYKEKLLFFDANKLKVCECGKNDVSTNSPSDLAYVIHTSGTTGTPKGVAMEHRSVSNTLLDINERFSIGNRDVCLTVSNFHFDLSVYDIYGIWATGGTVVIPDHEQFRNPHHWIQLMMKYRVTIWNSVPALMHMLCDAIEYEKLESKVSKFLKVIMLSGDKITTSLLNRIKRIFPKAKIYSLGGATEAAIWSIAYPLNDFKGPIIPYGYPLANQKIYVLNSFLEPCPENVVGEIYIGGAGLARCYLNNKQENDNHFFMHPVLNERLYRTGDLGKIDKNGLVWIIGRTDTQVKVRGYRVELGEINATLMNNPSIQDCVTVAKEMHDGEKTIVSYYLSKEHTTTPNLAVCLANYMRQYLPAHMVPSKFIPVESWPLNANGKVDIKALPDVEFCASYEEKSDNTLTATEVCIHRIFEDILKVQVKKTTDNFFALGGHSLLIPKVIRAIKAELNVELSFTDIYDLQSVANIAEKIDKVIGS